MNRFFILLLTICPALAFATESPCTKNTKIHKQKNVRQLEVAVQTALSKSDQAELKKLIACDFMIAKNESDIGGFRRGANIIPQLLKIFKGVKFKSKDEDFGSQINLDADTPNGTPGLVFREDDSSGWYWAGIGLDDSKELDSLLKESY